MAKNTSSDKEKNKAASSAPETDSTQDKTRTEPKAPSAETPETENKTPSPEEKVKELEKAVAELEDKRLRLIAEMDNQRKRASKDMETLRYSVMTDTLYPFFQVFDHFSMAVAAASATDNIKALTEGMKMIGNEFDRAFSDLGIERIDAVGKEFDPNTQEAVSQEASETVPAGIVLRQWCCGYRTKDRVLKPASVVVSSGAPAPDQDKQNA